MKVKFFFRRLWAVVKDWWGNFDGYKNYYMPRMYRDGEAYFQQAWWTWEQLQKNGKVIINEGKVIRY